MCIRDRFEVIKMLAFFVTNCTRKKKKKKKKNSFLYIFFLQSISVISLDLIVTWGCYYHLYANKVNLAVRNRLQ